MFLMRILRWFVLVAQIIIAAPILYLSTLSISAILSERRRTQKQNTTSSQWTNFAILIPAHNEELILHKLLDSLAKLNYPKDHYTVYVVADNCTDATAELARAAGVQVYERFNKELRGKGYALNWLMQKLEEEQHIHAAYIIFDADSVVDPGFLGAMNRELARGVHALQGSNTVLNTSESPSTALRWLAMTLVNHVRPLGRNGIGGSSTLNGNGMCLSRTLLQHYPWQAFSIAEDYQYYLLLVEHGERVRYVPDAIVRSQMPTTFEQMRTQDIRWEGAANEWETRQVALKLLRSGLQDHDFARVEAVAELMTPPLSLLAGSCALTSLASVAVWSRPRMLFSLLLMTGLLSYIGTGLYLMRPDRSVYRALLHAPGFMLWKLWVVLVLRRNKRYTHEWVRTSRTA